MPAEITHKTAFRWQPMLVALALSFFGGYVVGANDAAGESEPTAPQPSQTVHVTPGR